MAGLSVDEFCDMFDHLSAYSLASYARSIQDVAIYGDVKEENGFSDDDMREIIIYLVKKMMHRNLVIPSNGSAVNLLAIAQDLHDDPEFGGKYDRMAKEIDNEGKT